MHVNTAGVCIPICEICEKHTVRLGRLVVGWRAALMFN